MLNTYKLDKEMLSAVKTKNKARQVDILNKYIQRGLSTNPVAIMCSKYKRGI